MLDLVYRVQHNKKLNIILFLINLLADFCCGYSKQADQNLSRRITRTTNAV
jgi:hypothetical protein